MPLLFLTGLYRLLFPLDAILRRWCFPVRFLLFVLQVAGWEITWQLQHATDILSRKRKRFIGVGDGYPETKGTYRLGIVGKETA